MKITIEPLYPVKFTCNELELKPSLEYDLILRLFNVV